MFCTAAIAWAQFQGSASPLEWVARQSQASAGEGTRLLSAEALGAGAPARRSGNQADTVSPRNSSVLRLPLAFEAADDRAPGDAQYQAKGPGYLVFVGPGGAMLALKSGAGEANATGHSSARHRGWSDVASADGADSTLMPSGSKAGSSPRSGFSLVGLSLEGASSDASAAVEQPQAGRIHRLRGSDPARWQTGIQPAGRIRYRDVYPGIDVAYYGQGQELEYDFIVAPGASPDQARVRFHGIRSCDVDPSGQLRLATGSGELIQRRPVAYQDGPRGRQQVPVAYRKHEDGSIGFAVGPHDPERTLVIDPVLSYATYLGGTGYDQVWDIAVDGTGSAYVVGETESANFARLKILSTNSFKTNYQGGLANVAGDAFVAKLTPTGSAFEWLTYFGGSDLDVGLTIAVSGAGEAVIGGFTTSPNFPVTAGAFQSTIAGTTNRHTGRKPLEGFVTRLKADGSGLVASTLLGGTSEDQVIDLGLLPSGGVVAAGMTTSSNFPAGGGAGVLASAGGADAFIAVLSPTLGSLQLSKLLGGTSRDSAESVVVDAANGLVHVAGITISTNLPTVAALQPTRAGGTTEAFVAGLKLADLSVVYSTYLGGSFEDYAYRATLGLGGSVWIVGETSSTNFPVVGGIQTTNAGLSDGFVAKLSSDGQKIEFSTYLGGTSSDALWDVAADTTGGAQVSGESWSATLTGISTNSLQSTNAGQSDILIARIDAAGAIESTLFGGTGEERGTGIAFDGAGNVYVAGRVRNGLFRADTNGVVQSTFGGGEADGFVMKLANSPALAVAPAPGGVRVSWAAPNPGFVLESQIPNAEGPLAGWTRTPWAVTESKGRHEVLVPESEAGRIFRLRWSKQ